MIKNIEHYNTIRLNEVTKELTNQLKKEKLDIEINIFTIDKIKDMTKNEFDFIFKGEVITFKNNYEIRFFYHLLNKNGYKWITRKPLNEDEEMIYYENICLYIGYEEQDFITHGTLSGAIYDKKVKIINIFTEVVHNGK